MSQKTKTKTAPSTKSSMDELREEFGKVKASGVRKVKLKYKSCCGCGCYDVDIERTVPVDSPLKDGDRAKDFLSGDKMVE